MIQTVVEGGGEVQALPILLRRLLAELGCHVEVGSAPIKRHRSDFTSAEKFKTGLQLVQRRGDISAVLVVFDLDDDCARDLMPNLRQWAEEEIPHLPHALVAARREYEAWFVAALESLRGVRRIGDDAVYTEDPETKRDAKGALSRFMPRNAAYDPVADQPALTARFDMGQAYRRCSSFRKLVKELCRVLAELGQVPAVPPEWAAA